MSPPGCEGGWAWTAVVSNLLLQILDIAEEVAHQGTAFVDAFSSSSSLFPNLLDVSGVTFLGLDMQNRDNFFLTGGPSYVARRGGEASSDGSSAAVESVAAHR